MFETLATKAFYPILEPIVMYTIGIAIYGIVVWNFYRFLARRDIIYLNLGQYNKVEHPVAKKFLAILLFFIEFIVLFPLFIFIWFSVLAFLLVMLAKNQPTINILVTSMSVVTAVRLTAYYNEDLSKDLAKMLPFALLGVFLIDSGALSFAAAKAHVLGVSAFAKNLMYYGIFTLVLEAVLRTVHGIRTLIVEMKASANKKPKKKKSKKKKKRKK